MTIYLNHDSFAQPLPTEGQHSGEISKNLKPQEESDDSEGEVFPDRPGCEFASQEEVCEAIEQAYKKNRNLQVKLIMYAQRKIKEIIGSKHDGRLQPDDIVEEAIYRILNGKRKWYKEKISTIERLIFLVIVSLIRIEAEQIPNLQDNLYNPVETGKDDKEKKIKKPRIIPLYYSKKSDWDKNDNSNTAADIEKYKNADKSQFEDELDFEAEEEKGTIEKLMDEYEDKDEIAYFVLDEMLNGNKSHKDIANKYGIEVREVVNAYKRIQRRVFKNNNTK